MSFHATPRIVLPAVRHMLKCRAHAPTNGADIISDYARIDLNRVEFLVTLSVLNSKITFSKPYKGKCIGEVVRIGSINHLSAESALKSQILYTV